ncbi:MAG: ABC-type transport auxiliary lipoprotein family protein [Halomonas sp.]|nr:ABC-type transport auxiliary lipoprotein family protein [Halomonas sp.]MDN6297355.1 ABC-type transport auxiliary lipoprotein family protein [Halomonas sp.]MDN6314116.1 ABC-type transport auxiliary lipoprotein family protein [Halomonas sp.]MDN6335340.1 ABC-type transport auxiliary lipoprotein family protein [Halomonas sp.]
MSVYQRLPFIVATLMLLGLGLSGCAGTVTPPTRYLLPSTAPVTPASPDATLEIARLRLAHYLDVDGIVMQLDDIELREARDHQWAEGLDQQLARNLQAHLSRHLPEWRITQGQSGDDNALSLHISIDQFQGRHDGYALASGQWQLRDEQNRLMHMASFQTRTALESDGYPALVRALGQSFEKASQDIAIAIRRAVL